MSDYNLLSSLLFVSEKAANIARVCRHDEHLLSLLVQEKKETEKNPRFLHDFKTLADVLVQEVVKHELCEKFPILNGEVFGEESNEFSTEDETVIVEVKSNQDDTAKMLYRLLLDEAASNTLAQVIHSKIDVNIKCDELDTTNLPERIGVWIDPIDSTGEYIQGNEGEEGTPVKSGLPCVTILIGVFDRDTGKPIIGVVNQPFYKKENFQWSGRVVYGFNIGELNTSSPAFSFNPSEKIVAVSSTETDDIKGILQCNGYTTIELAGAGYKLLSIITGDVHAYVLSKPTTFLWDICACNAILNSIGGGVIEYHTLQPIIYKGGIGIGDCCNAGGILAFRNSDIKDDLIEILNLKPN